MRRPIKPVLRSTTCMINFILKFVDTVVEEKMFNAQPFIAAAHSSNIVFIVLAIVLILPERNIYLKDSGDMSNSITAFVPEFCLLLNKLQIVMQYERFFCTIFFIHMNLDPMSCFAFRILIDRSKIHIARI